MLASTHLSGLRSIPGVPWPGSAHTGLWIAAGICAAVVVISVIAIEAADGEVEIANFGAMFGALAGLAFAGVAFFGSGESDTTYRAKVENAVETHWPDLNIAIVDTTFGSSREMLPIWVYNRRGDGTLDTRDCTVLNDPKPGGKLSIISDPKDVQRGAPLDCSVPWDQTSDEVPDDAT